LRGKKGEVEGLGSALLVEVDGAENEVVDAGDFGAVPCGRNRRHRPVSVGADGEGRGYRSQK